MANKPKPPQVKQCECPLYCRYCGAGLRQDWLGHYCPTHNCQWAHGVEGCLWTQPSG